VSRILVVEDSPTQSEHLRLILQNEGFAVEVVADAEQAFERLLASVFDLVLSDIVMPGISGFDLCRQVKTHPQTNDVPVILLTTLNDPLDILKGIESGADNYITKPFEPAILVRRIRDLFAKRQRRTEGKLKLGVEVDFLGTTLTITSDKEQILDLLISTCEDIVRANRNLRARESELVQVQVELEQRVRERTSALAQANAALRQEIDERKQAQTTLNREREFLKAVLENDQDGILACDAQGVLTYCNGAAREFLGQSHLPLSADAWALTPLFRTDGRTPLTREEIPLARALRGERIRDEEVIISPEGGTTRTLLVGGQPIRGMGGMTLGAVVVMHDLTERNRLERQLRQAQKMEAIGRLAGGVAHDFNNLLTVIIGYGEVLLTTLSPDDPSQPLISEIKKAGDRAASLTRQLLAFSRQQVIAPRVMDVNAVVTDVEKMLRRVIGEDVALTCVLNPALGSVRADSSQMEQLLLNLAINARDAMPSGGQLTIETDNVELDVHAHDFRPEVRPGSYIRLVVRDTGCGMDEETRSHIFEPFFTTKGLGKGTGLGLATVYGIVKQSDGYIYVDSDLGQGTTFRVYLPKVKSAASAHPEPRRVEKGRGAETILLVEDDDAVRAITRHVLEVNGYRVLEASRGIEAIRLFEESSGSIHLLLTDVVMPEMSGCELAQRLMNGRPGLRVLFVSGYTDAAVRHSMIQDAPFLQKPFSMDALTRTVRETLDRPESSGDRGV
jgi:PAS domain S-box-containing protein